MIGDSTNVSTGGGSINILNGAIGKGNTISGNQSAISNSFNLSETSNRDDFISALHQIKNELIKANDLPKGEAKDLKYNVDEAIEASEEKPPKKERVIDKLTTMQKILESLKDSGSSAIALGKLIREVLLSAGSFL
jgi:hypothetical protein